MTKLIVALLLVGVLSGCGSSSSSTQATKESPKKEIPQILAADIASDNPAMPRCKQLYEMYCQHCHKLPVPSSKSEEKWLKVMPIMAAKAKIDGMTSDSISIYVNAARLAGK